MTPQDQDNAVSPPQSSAPLVAAPAPPMPPMAFPGAGIGAPGGTDVLKGGMDRSSLFHALRRRFVLASGLGLLLASAVGAALWILLPETNSATAQYEVSSSQLALLDRSTSQTKDYEVFQRTQVAYIRSPFVLQTALGQNEGAISRLPMFKDADDQVEWLRDNLRVSFPDDGEILQIAMTGPHPKQDLKQVVEAVCKAYNDEVIFRDQARQRLPVQILKKSFAKLRASVREKTEEFQKLAKESGTSIAYANGFDPETKFLLSELSELLSRQRQLTDTLTEATSNHQILEAQVNDPDAQEFLVSQQMQGDPLIAALQQEVLAKQFEIRTLRSTLKRGTSATIKQLERQVAATQQEIAAAQQQLRAQIAGSQSDNPDPAVKMETIRYQISRTRLQAELAQIGKRMEEVKQELLLKAENNTELMLRQNELQQLEQVESAIAQRIQNLQVEIQAPNRVRPLGENLDGAAIAQTAQNRNRLMRIALTGLGSLSTLGLTCFAIGYMEFCNRHLNNADQVEEGLGIRVIGTLPGLSGKKALNPKHPVVAQLTESIASVRTALMHESTSKRRQIVLVTSPETSEGRTTVASQLAASLAKAGRRTLLIDGDLRRPALHTLFNSPLEDGFCEVLRAEAEVADVIRPTQAEGLWLMTAGYCDADAVQALATDQVEPIMEKLRADYDFVIIDGAPVIGLSDSLQFGQHVDGAILSVLRDRSCVTQIHRSAELLRSVGVTIIGSVVNGVGSKADRRVTHLQQVTPKSEQKKIASVAAAAPAPAASDESVSDDIDFDLDLES